MQSLGGTGAGTTATGTMKVVVNPPWFPTSMKIGLGEKTAVVLKRPVNVLSSQVRTGSVHCVFIVSSEKATTKVIGQLSFDWMRGTPTSSAPNFLMAKSAGVVASAS